MHWVPAIVSQIFRRATRWSYWSIPPVLAARLRLLHAPDQHYCTSDFCNPTTYIHPTLQKEKSPTTFVTSRPHFTEYCRTPDPPSSSNILRHASSHPPQQSWHRATWSQKTGAIKILGKVVNECCGRFHIPKLCRTRSKWANMNEAFLETYNKYFVLRVNSCSYKLNRLRSHSSQNNNQLLL